MTGTDTLAIESRITTLFQNGQKSIHQKNLPADPSPAKLKVIRGMRLNMSH